MPIRRFDDAELKKIIEKYIRSVRRDPETVPNIREIITEALKDVAPERDVDPEDVTSVLWKLSKKPTITDKIISEAAKDVLDHSALEDLKHMIVRNAQQLGKKYTPDDIDNIIKQGKLDPYSSSLSDIRKAVTSYYETGRHLEHIPPEEIKNKIRKELEKHGPVDERDLNAVYSKFMDEADQDKPLDGDKLAELAKSQVASRGKPAEPQNKEEQKKEKSTRHEVKQGGWVPPKDPLHPTFFEKIRLKMRRYGMKSLTRGARNWMTDEVQNLSRMSRQKLMKEGESVAEAFVGKMFLYFYDAKTKKVLPYWDKFPLIFVIEMYDDGWLGINLHYLPLNIRVRLFDKLLQYADDKSLDKITKLKLSYQLLKSVSQYPEVRPCIKRYLAGYVKSSLLPIAAVDWEVALFLPVEQFQKQPKETVWAESRKKIAKLRRRK